MSVAAHAGRYRPALCMFWRTTIASMALAATIAKTADTRLFFFHRAALDRRCIPLGNAHNGLL